MIQSRTAQALGAAARPLRIRLAWLAAVGAAAGFAVVLALAAWSARVGLVRAPIWVPMAWTAAILVAALCLGLVGRAARDWVLPRIAFRLEGSHEWRAGALRGLLEPPALGTSGGLHAAADAAAARDLAARGSDVLRGAVRRAGRFLLVASLALAGSLILVGAAGVRSGPAALLWEPRQALAMLTSSLGISADRPLVRAGDSVALLIRAPGRRAVTLWTRSPGTMWLAVRVELDSLGEARREAGPLTEALYAHVTEGRHSSDTLEIAVRRPAFLASLNLTIHYPAYLHLEDEPAPAGGDTLLLPAGSRIETRGEATVPLGGARWGGERDGNGIGLTLEGARFAGGFAPAVTGRYRLILHTADGEPLSGDETVLVVRVQADERPVVEIPVPAGDTTAPATGALPMVIDARDDHGLTEVALERRVIHGGAVRVLAEEFLPLPGVTPDRAILPAAIDPAGLGLAPGDTLKVLARARDNSPARQLARSREIVISVPTQLELRTEERDRAKQIQRQLDSLVAESRSAQRQSEDLGREQQRGPEGALEFDAAKKGEAVAERQERLLKEAEAVRRAVDELRKAAERAGIADSEFQRRLKEVQDQLDQALSPELRRQLAELQEALKALNRERTQKAVRRMGEAQAKLKEALERSRELFRRAVLEGELASLEQETKELVRDQKSWNERIPAADSSQAAKEETSLSHRTDSVAAGLDQAAKQLSGAERRAALQNAAEEAKAGASEMQQGSRAAQQGQMQQAQRAGQKAADRMSKVQQQVQQQREGQQQEWRQEVVAALDRALLETTRLAARQLAVTELFRRDGGSAGARNAEGAVEEGAQKLLDQVAAASGKNALVSPQILAALAEARLQMQQAREGAASASGNVRESVDKAGEAVDALNVAAYGLLRSREDVAGSGSGSGFAEMMQRMTRLAKQQGQLSQDANGLLPMMGAPSIQQQLQAMAARQRALAQELERLRAQGQADAKPLGDEARDLARALERGRLDRDMVARQERLFRRMLDAGRTLQGREEDERKERQSETAKSGEVHLPPALRAQLLGTDAEIRLPTWEQLQRLSPDERRLVTEYFRRLAGGVP